MKRKIMAAGMMILLAAGLTACTGGGQSAGYETMAKEGFEPVVLRFGNQHPTDSTASDSDRRICERIAEATEGRVTVNLYTDSALGDYTSVFEELMMGTVDMAHISAVETYDSRMSGSMLPYLGSNYEELRVAYDPDNYLYQTVKEVAEKMGIHTFGFYCEGFTGTATSKEVTNAAESGTDKGVIVRVPGVDNFALPEKNLGFRTSTIAYSDTYTAIQTGTVDGLCGCPPNLIYLYFRDVSKNYYHYMMTQEATQIMMSDKTWNKLLPEDQAAIEEIIQDECAKSIDLAAADDDKYMNMMREEGINVVEFTDEEREAMAQACRENVWPSLAKNTSQEFLDNILKSIQ